MILDKKNKENLEIIHNNNINNNNLINNNIKGENIVNNLSTNIAHKNNNEKEIIFFDENNYIDEEINILPYNLAIKYDKRTYCNYYISLLKTKHNLIFALLNNDYNSRVIKMSLFLIGFAIKYIVNALFFNDDTMNKIYESKGKYNLEVQIPIIVYSSLISMIFNTVLSILALSNDVIISFKQNRATINLNRREEDLINKLNIKFILYFIISSLLLLFFWYYISMFCVIYKNTQIHLLTDTLISFGLSLLFPFGIYLFPGLFRIPALSNSKDKRECIYNFSKFLQLL